MLATSCSPTQLCLYEKLIMVECKIRSLALAVPYRSRSVGGFRTNQTVSVGDQH